VLKIIKKKHFVDEFVKIIIVTLNNLNNIFSTLFDLKFYYNIISYILDIFIKFQAEFDIKKIISISKDW
jgi:hypothetical protein